MIGLASKGRFWAVATLAALLAGGQAFAQGHGGGGHFGGGGGGHSFGGGAHFSGGAHFGGAPHFSGGGHFGGAPHFSGGTHFGGAPHYYSGGARMGYSPRPSFSSHGYVAGGGAYHGGYTARPGYAPHAGYVRPGGVRPGFYGRPGYGHYWAGGYWHGAFWPRAYYGWGFPLFLAALPVGYATFYWGGIPYYYCNDVYYTWNVGQNGYVVTDPPPVAGTADDNSDVDQAEAPPASTGTDVYAYPQNGQTQEQESNDKYECHTWARSQTGFDPTVSNSTGSPDDYRRAMIACLSARGYSAQ